MRIVFMGTPDFAVPVLGALVEAGHELVAAYTRPPRPGGRRGRAAVPSPVQARAEALGIAVRHPVTLRDADAQAKFAELEADVAVVAAYGLILPRAVLDAPRLGCLNVHGSALPRWRGAAPVQRAILAGDAETGVDIMRMEAGLDTGPVLASARTAVDGKSAGELAAELAALGSALMVEVLADLSAFPEMAQPDEGVSYAAKVEKEELRLDFSGIAEQVERQVRAFHPPGAWFEVNGERVRVLAAQVCAREGGEPDWAPPFAGAHAAGVVVDDQLTIACGSGAIRPTLVQRAGRGVMSAGELLRGFAIPIGTRL